MVVELPGASVASGGVGGGVSCRALMQAHALSELQHQRASGGAVAAATMLSLVQLL